MRWENCANSYLEQYHYDQYNHLVGRRYGYRERGFVRINYYGGRVDLCEMEDDEHRFIIDYRISLCSGQFPVLLKWDLFDAKA